jgi:import inner membrane translocase subunit TIM17
MRNGAISCAILLAVIEGVSIGFNRMMADNTKLEAPPLPPTDAGASPSGGLALPA